MRRSRVFTVLVVSALVFATVRAAPAGRPGRVQQVATRQQTPPKPVFRSGVNLVEVDAVVLDVTNRPVADLRQRDFQVLENGKPQEIVTFARVELPMPPPREPARSDVTANAGAEEGRVILLVLDDPNSLSARTDAIKQAARRLVEQLSPQDQVALLWVSLDRRGAREFTTDHASILQAIDLFQAEQSRVERRVGPNSQAALPEDPTGESALSDESRMVGGANLKALFDADRPFRVAEDVGRYLAGVEWRRKAIVYIGQGQTRQSLDADLALPVDRAIAAATGGNVTFYSIDPSGPPERDPAKRDRVSTAQAQSDFARLASATGGFTSFQADVNQAVDRVVQATSVYYLLAYYSEPAAPGGRPRNIEVRATRAGLRILARKTYQPDDVARTATGAPNDAMRAVRDIVPRAELRLKAFAAPFRDASKSEQPIEVAVEVSAPEFAPGTPPAAFADEVALIAVAVEPGEKVRATRQVTTRVALDAARAAALGTGRYLLRTRVAVPPGQYQLRLGARSAVAGRAGSVYCDVTVPDFRSRPLSLSGVVVGWATKRDPMPVASTDGSAALLPFEPVLTREFMRGDGAWAYARVYRGKDGAHGQALLTTSVIRLDDGTAVWTSSEPRAASEFGSDGEVEYRVAVPLDDLQAGAYRLRVDAALDGTLAARRELDFSVKSAATAPAPSAAVPPAATRRPPAVGLEDLIDRTSRYVASYADDLSSVVSEEAYEQSLSVVRVSFNRSSRTMFTRQLRSDFLLVRLPGEPGWTPFRDVFEVDGKAVRDRDDRLRKLFLEMPPGALTTARDILNESARYNIGDVARNINQPVLPLVFLLPENQPRFRFRDRGEEAVDGVRTRRVDYEETSRPTIIRQLGSDKDMPAKGSLWIDAATGRIVKTEVETTDGLFRVEMSVVYRPDETLGLWVPAEMRETYTSGSERIYGKATYGNFRRFQVKTEAVIKVPKR